MDFTALQWLTALIVILIAGIFLDGFRRMRKARRDSLHMSLDRKKKSTDISGNGAASGYGSEFPNGGARVSQKKIDEDRIAKIRNQYDFGADLKNMNVGNSSSDKSEENESKRSHTAGYQGEQWVDADETDEEYYAEKWDDVDNEQDRFDDDVAQTGIDTHIEVEKNRAVGENEDINPEKVVEADINIGNNTYSTDKSEMDEDNLPPLKAEKLAERKVFRDSKTVDNNESTGTLSTSTNEESDISSRPAITPEQVPLNLEESVPVLMDTTHLDPEVQDILLDEKGEERDREPTIEIRSVGKRLKKMVEPTIGEDVEVTEVHERSANKPRYKSKYYSHETSQSKTDHVTEEVLIIHVQTTGDVFQGSDLLHQILDKGLRYGAMDIFHYHEDEDGEGPILFSVANMLVPGVFDLKTIDTLTTVGVTFFLTLPVADDANMAAFEQMVAIAKSMAVELGGELKDDQRSVMTGQTIEHYRERIRDFSRKQRLEKNK